MRTINCSLDLPPSSNHIYGRRKGGIGTYLTGDGKAWRDLAIWTLKDKRVGTWAKISIHVKFYFPDYRRRDTDNLMKLLMDAITKSGIIADDNWTVVKRTVVQGFLDKNNPRLDLEIKEL